MEKQNHPSEWLSLFWWIVSGILVLFLLGLLSILMSDRTSLKETKSIPIQKYDNTNIPKIVAIPPKEKPLQNKNIKISDTEIYKNFETLSKEWNAIAWEIVTPYLDPTVPADVWVKNTSKWLPELRIVHMKMKAQLLVFPPSENKQKIQQLVDLYEQKISALTSLHFAVSQGNTAEEKVAREKLTLLGKESDAIAKDLIQSSQ